MAHHYPMKRLRVRPKKERDRQIVEQVLNGQDMEAVAKEHKMSKTYVRDVVSWSCRDKDPDLYMKGYAALRKKGFYRRAKSGIISFLIENREHFLED